MPLKVTSPKFSEGKVIIDKKLDKKNSTDK